MQEAKNPLYDKVSAIVISAFNEQGIPYGPRAKHSYPVKWEDVFSDPCGGGGQQAADECRAIMLYILANHIPVMDLMRCEQRLASNTYLFTYFKRSTRDWVNKRLGTACRLIVREEYKSAYNRALIACRASGIELWNVDKPQRIGNCDQQ